MQLGYNMDVIWMFINLAVCIVLMFVLPMALIVYNEDSDEIVDVW